MGLPDEQLLNPQAVSKALRCVICTEVFVKPVSSICQHVFCRRCIERALGRNARCPTCRSPLNAWELNPNPLVQTLLDEVLVRCPRFRDSCAWTGPQEASAAHEAACPVLERLNLAQRLDLKEQALKEQADTIESLRGQVCQQEQLVDHLKSQAVRQERQLAELRRELRTKDQELAKTKRGTALIRADVQAELAAQWASKAQADADLARQNLESLRSNDEVIQAFVTWWPVTLYLFFVYSFPDKIANPKRVPLS